MSKEVPAGNGGAARWGHRPQPSAEDRAGAGGVNFNSYDGILNAGRTVGTNFDNHHWIPQSTHNTLKQRYPGLSNGDLNFTEPLEDGFHSWLHGKGAQGTLQEAYNGQVNTWLRNNPSASQTEFLGFISNLRDDYMTLYQSYILHQ